MTVTVSATAASRGGAATPYNVAIVVDTTLSMLFPDADCGSTQIACAMNGIQVLLKNLSPCAASLAKCTIKNGVAASSVDRVALFTFPNVSTATAAQDTTCTTAVPTPTAQNRYWSMVNNGTTINFVMPMSTTGTTPVTPWSSLPAAMAYSFPTVGASSYVPAQSDFATYPMTLGPATYQVTQFLSDYRTSNSATLLNPNSTLVKAAGGVIGCGSMMSPNYAGVFGTYYPGAIYAAQSALVAVKAANPGTENVLIILSDGDATAPQINGNNTVMGSPATSSGQYPSCWRVWARRSLRLNMPPARVRNGCTRSPMVLSRQDVPAIKAAALIPTSPLATPWRIWPALRNTSTPITTKADPAVTAWPASRSRR